MHWKSGSSRLIPRARLIPDRTIFSNGRTSGVSLMRRIMYGFVFLIGLLSFAAHASAEDKATIAGTIVDPLGARVAKAAVTPMRDGQRVAATTSNERGEFSFDVPAAGRYEIATQAEGFARKTT